MHRLLVIAALAISLTTPFRAHAQSVDQQTSKIPPGAKLLDDKLVMYLRPVPLISPNGKLVAYVSRGFVCVAYVETGEVRRLFEVRDSWSHVFASAEGSKDGGDPASLMRALDEGEYKQLQSRAKNEIVAMQWTITSDAVVFGVQSNDSTRSIVQTRFWRIPLTGDAKEIANTQTSYESYRGNVPDIRLTRNERYLVEYAQSNPLIWDLATNTPRATPFLSMTSSSTSGHWIAFEKDSRQLVALDEDFNVVSRYDEYAPKSDYGFDMIWSQDERFIIWRQEIGIDWYSNWVGCRYDLQTHDRTILTGDYWDETLVFTGQRGEILRFGSAGKQGIVTGLILTANFVQILPDASPFPRDVWRVDSDRDASDAEKLLNPVFNRHSEIFGVPYSQNFDRFVIAIPRQDDSHGFSMRLIDRERHITRLSPSDSDSYYSPYRVAGFAQNGSSIIGYDDKRLFVFPLSALPGPEKSLR